MYLGIDLGTSEVKILLLDEHQDVVASSGESLTLSRPHPLWSEQDPEHWWAAVERGISKLKHAHANALASVKGIGLSGQMHGAILLDKRYQVLRPAIL